MSCETLPNDILTIILSKSSKQSFFFCMMSCKTLFDNETLWKWGANNILNISTMLKSSWRLTCQFLQHVVAPYSLSLIRKKLKEGMFITHRIEIFGDNNCVVVLSDKKMFYYTCDGDDFFHLRLEGVLKCEADKNIVGDKPTTVEVTNIIGSHHNNIIAVINNQLYDVRITKDSENSIVGYCTRDETFKNKTVTQYVNFYDGCCGVVANGELYTKSSLYATFPNRFGQLGHFCNTSKIENYTQFSRLTNVTFVKNINLMLVIADKKLYAFGLNSYNIPFDRKLNWYDIPPDSKLNWFPTKDFIIAGLVQGFDNVTKVVIKETIVAIINNGGLYLYAELFPNCGKQCLNGEVTDVVITVRDFYHTITIIMDHKVYSLTIDYGSIFVNKQTKFPFGMNFQQESEYAYAEKFIVFDKWFSVLGIKY